VLVHTCPCMHCVFICRLKLHSSHADALADPTCSHVAVRYVRQYKRPPPPGCCSQPTISKPLQIPGVLFLPCTVSSCLAFSLPKPAASHPLLLPAPESVTALLPYLSLLVPACIVPSCLACLPPVLFYTRAGGAKAGVGNKTNLQCHQLQVG
jgi:hypothetical protein